MDRSENPPNHHDHLNYYFLVKDLTEISQNMPD